MKKPKPFATEADLCARFLSAIPEEWTAYPEWGGWDILLVRKEDGFQVGIEAKLHLNAKVLTQALEEYGSWHAGSPGPDCRAILVPESEHGYGVIAAYIGITVIRVYGVEKRYGRGNVFYPDLPNNLRGHGGTSESWHEWLPLKRHKLPDYVPDVVAGAPAPLRLTDWKIKAIKIAITLETRGFVTRADFKHLSIDHRRWLPSGTGWLSIEDGRYVKGPHFPNLRAQHPVVYEQIVADVEKWMLKEAPVPPKQKELL